MALKAWPTVTNRNVAQPSRVRLSTAPEAGADVYDVTPVPGTVMAEGTLINEALFSGEKAYVDQNDVPVVTATSNDGIGYIATVPQWQGMTAAEMNGRILVVLFARTSASTTCTLNINGLGASNIYLSSGTSTSGGAAFPKADYLSVNHTTVMKYDSTQNYWHILSASSRPYGGAYVTNMWAIAAGGTGGNTAAAARTNLSTLAYGAVSENSARILPPSGDANTVVWWRIGSTASGDNGGVVPATRDTTNGWGYAGTSLDPWRAVWAKTLNGTINVSNLSGIVPIGNGGTGANTKAIGANNLSVLSIGNGFTGIPSGSDLNNFTTYGNYGTYLTINAQTILNTPHGATASASALAFNLTVEASLRANSTKYVRQIYQEYKPTSLKYARTLIENTSTWSDWKVVEGDGYATTTSPGLVKVDGTTITINSAGVLSSTGGGGGGGYTLPVASASTLGGIKVGSGLSVTADGTLSATSSSEIIPITRGGTGANSIGGAVNSLKVKFIGEGLPALTNGTDLNEITTFGNYGVASDVVARTILNTPYSATTSPNVYAFNLTVEGALAASTSGNYIRQTFKEHLNTTATYTRVSSNGGTSWTAWQQITLEKSVPVAQGGTGATTATNARANLAVPMYAVDNSNVDSITILAPNGTPAQWTSQGYKTSNLGGILPRVADTSAGWNNIGASAWPFISLWAKTLNGTLNTSNLSGIVPISNGGTGAITTGGAANTLSVRTIGNGAVTIPNGADLNTYLAAGNYGVHADVNAHTILNTPYGAAASSAPVSFNLTVENAISASTNGRYLRQVFKEYPATRPTYSRGSINGGESWTAWLQSTIESGVPITLGGTGAVTATAAKSNLGLGQYIGPAATGSDTQIKSIFRLTEKVYIVESVLNLAGTSGTGLQKLGELKVPFDLITPQAGSTSLMGATQLLAATVSTGGYVSLSYQDKNTIALDTYASGGSTAASTARCVLIIAAA